VQGSCTVSVQSSGGEVSLRVCRVSFGMWLHAAAASGCSVCIDAWVAASFDCCMLMDKGPPALIGACRCMGGHQHTFCAMLLVLLLCCGAPPGNSAAVLCSAVQNCAVLCSTVLCFAVLCCAVQEHWLAIRKLNQQWWNLNSLFPAPQPLGDIYLSAFLATLQQQGYSIFVVSFSPIGLHGGLFIAPCIECVR
jgi:Josephin